jgi:hypothetical protein
MIHGLLGTDPVDLPLVRFSGFALYNLGRRCGISGNEMKGQAGNHFLMPLHNIVSALRHARPQY